VTERRAYTGWKAALAAIGATVVVFVTINLLTREYAPRPDPAPRPTVVSVTPSR
jgi:hypothetical protein